MRQEIPWTAWVAFAAVLLSLAAVPLVDGSRQFATVGNLAWLAVAVTTFGLLSDAGGKLDGASGKYRGRVFVRVIYGVLWLSALLAISMWILTREWYGVQI